MDEQLNAGHKTLGSTFRKSVLIVVPVIAVILLGLYFWKGALLSSVAETPPNDAPNVFNGMKYDNLLKDSISFSQADQYAKSRQFDKAREYFTKSLTETSDQASKGIIQFRLAILEGDAGDYLKSTDMLRDIVVRADKSSFITRAYAILEMGLLYYKFADDKITDHIFQGDVYYKSIRYPNDIKLTYRKLFEEASRLYPIALSELRIADWYANELYMSENKQIPALDAKTKAAYEQIVKTRLAGAQLDFDRIKNLPAEYSRYGLQVLLRKAVVISKLVELGDTSYGSIDDSFMAVLNAYAARPGADGYVRYQYALALSHMSGDHVAQIHEVLSPLYTNTDVYKNSSVISFLKNERANVLKVKDGLVVMAKIDPGFRTYLKTLGWTDSDFATN